MKKNSFLVLDATKVAMPALALVLVLAFIGCATASGNGNSAEITVEQAFEDVWKYFGNPEISDWADQGYTAQSFDFYVGSFNESGWNTALAYLESLPASFYGERLDWNSDQVQQGFRFGLQLRRYFEWAGGGDFLQLEFNYPVNGKRYKIDLTKVAPEKALEIARTMVDRVK